MRALIAMILAPALLAWLFTGAPLIVCGFTAVGVGAVLAALLPALPQKGPR